MLSTTTAKQQLRLKNTDLVLIAPHIAEAAADIKGQLAPHVPLHILENSFLGDYEALFDFCLLELNNI